MSRCSGERSAGDPARAVSVERARVGVVADHVGQVDAAAGHAEAARPHVVAERRADGVGLAGQHRLVELQRREPRAAGRRRPPARPARAGRRRPRRRPRPAPRRVSPSRMHARARGDEQRQPVELPLGPQLLEDPDRRVDDHDAHEQQVRVLADGDQRDREPDQDQVEQRERVLADDRARRAARALLLDGSARIQAAFRLGVTQPDCGSHRLHAIGRLRVRRARTRARRRRQARSAAAACGLRVVVVPRRVARPAVVREHDEEDEDADDDDGAQDERQEALHRRETSVRATDP